MRHGKDDLDPVRSRWTRSDPDAGPARSLTRARGMSKAEDESWYREWRVALESVIRVQIPVDHTLHPRQREAAQKKCDAAFAAH
jgi:hypothetical protein